MIYSESRVVVSFTHVVLELVLREDRISFKAPFFAGEGGRELLSEVLLHEFSWDNVEIILYGKISLHVTAIEHRKNLCRMTFSHALTQKDIYYRYYQSCNIHVYQCRS